MLLIAPHCGAKRHFSKGFNAQFIANLIIVLFLPVLQPAAMNKTDFEGCSIINLRLTTVREREGSKSLLLALLTQCNGPRMAS